MWLYLSYIASMILRLLEGISTTNLSRTENRVFFSWKVYVLFTLLFVFVFAVILRRHCSHFCSAFTPSPLSSSIEWCIPASGPTLSRLLSHCRTVAIALKWLNKNMTQSIYKPVYTVILNVDSHRKGWRWRVSKLIRFEYQFHFQVQ